MVFTRSVNGWSSTRSLSPFRFAPSGVPEAEDRFAVTTPPGSVTGVGVTSTGTPSDASRDVSHGTDALASPAADISTRPSSASNSAPPATARPRRKPCCDFIINTFSACEIPLRPSGATAAPSPSQ